MNNNSKSGLVAILSVLALGLASVGLLGRGAPAQAAQAPDAPSVVEMPEMTVTAPAPAVQVDYSVWQKPAGSNSARPRAASKAARKPAAAPRTVVRDLEQGGIFGVGTSSTQTVRCVG